MGQCTHPCHLQNASWFSFLSCNANVYAQSQYSIDHFVVSATSLIRSGYHSRDRLRSPQHPFCAPGWLWSSRGSFASKTRLPPAGLINRQRSSSRTRVDAMAIERTHPLPEERNPLLVEEKAPDHSILVERRCLGQTELKVSSGQKGLSNATKPSNLGTLDYAHLRVPLPKDLGTSGIFTKTSSRKFPEAYFLMRRSSDGYVSATGMFKAAFPYAQQEEELAEKEYVKSLEAASPEEVAGNVWIKADAALDLADEYGIRLWIDALLDPEPITHGNDPSKDIRSPPRFEPERKMNNSIRSPRKRGGSVADGARSTRTTRQSTRSPEPGATARTPRALKTPRSQRLKKPRGASVTSTDAAESVNGENKLSDLSTIDEASKSPGATAQVNVTETVNEDGLAKTKVSIDMPVGHPELPLPEDTEAMLKEARRMVEEAKKIGGPQMTASSSKGKRKAEEMIAGDDGEELEGPAAPAKKPKMEVEFRNQRMKTRALFGIVSTLTVGALVPTIMAAFGVS
ncbi:bouquet formation protein 4-like [Teratosphaeria destructans]|uniref:Bouquet formation protein 4-like n=1 Tax=Teratosphaeria destructans TaxID=418781 RepID=A0A9W7SSB3_9PEZI|nr:bouquet formation protein 4-like [Teratosphaeria destructans]